MKRVFLSALAALVAAVGLAGTELNNPAPVAASDIDIVSSIIDVYITNDIDYIAGALAGANAASNTLYDGPFKVSIKPGTTNKVLLVGDGMVYAGYLARANWPNTYTTNVPGASYWASYAAGYDEVEDIASPASSTNLVVFPVSVDPGTGFFSETNLPSRPYLVPFPSAANLPTQELDRASYILATVVMNASKQFTSIRQDQRSHIYVPVRRVTAGGPYKASLFATDDSNN